MIRESLANGSSPAGSGWTGDLVKGLIGDKDCLGLGAIVRDILSGSLPRPLLVSSILIAWIRTLGVSVPASAFIN